MVQGPRLQRVHGISRCHGVRTCGGAVKDPEVRQALLDLVAHAVSRQLTAAQALQERIRRMF